MATRRSTTNRRQQMAPRSTSTSPSPSPPKVAGRIFTFTSDEIRSIKIVPGRKKDVPKEQTGVASRKIITNPPPPPPLTIEVKLKPKK